ncbi:MAG: DUF2075 domain-containing protein [Bryobacterales bacterium]|nr:DUF2075 domain-containing protein [Acidobacteriota bacterium]MCB9383200.1 DUF2075 domain-containing protein [Bryobacterales bacterium]
MNDLAGGARGWLSAKLAQFCAMSPSDALGRLAHSSSGTGFAATSNRQIDAWTHQLPLLIREMSVLIRLRPEGAEWTLILEYEIPRRQKRIDAVLLAGETIFSIEVKIHSSSFGRADLWQAEDYALDLQDYHLASRGLKVIPILVASEADSLDAPVRGAQLAVHCVGACGLAERVTQLANANRGRIDPANWDASPYSPTPSIIQATQQLFSSHSVANLSHAYADNLGTTVAAVDRAVQLAKSTGNHTICFVTGVPGAGKTLAGLAAIHASTAVQGDEDIRGAYLSGNGPLVSVLREAVARDAASHSGTLKEARRQTEALIQNVHGFVEEHGVKRRDLAPDEDVVVFDEAQRAWHQQKLAKRHKSVCQSEPALMLDIMSRKPRWSVVVALIGGGQEIHDGEAGLEEWGRALTESGRAWRVVASPEVLRGGQSVASQRLFEQLPGTDSKLEVVEEPSMHLSVSVRSPRARYLAEWVNAVLALQPEEARKAIEKIEGFRLGLTRSLPGARAWLRDAARDEFRPGLVASSGALRLRAYGIEMDPQFLNAYPLAHWFLAPRDDVRSSHALEVAMSEFKVQGLELDLVGLCWGCDLTLSASRRWDSRRFNGGKWTNVRDAVKREYLLNKYRVLMTRGREGMVIWVPSGSADDPTRDPDRLDRTAAFLQECGLTPIDD